MKNKIGYAIIISCFFLISGGTTRVSAYNADRINKSYKFGVPDYAKGIDLELEVTEYDKDEWRDHFGYDSEPDEIFGGTNYDADVVGAKSKSDIRDWEREKDNIPFFSDFVLTAEQHVEDIPTAENLNDVIDYIKININLLGENLTANPAAEKPILFVMWGMMWSDFGRAVETGIKGLDPATQIIGDVWVDGNTIILEFEYADPNEERDGWKVKFTYDEYGIQELIVFSGSEIFYEQELLPSSLEQRIVSSVVTTSVIMGVIAIGLISFYVIYKLKKRKGR